MESEKVIFINDELEQAFNNVEIISLLLDWMNHKDYEKLFKF